MFHALEMLSPEDLEIVRHYIGDLDREPITLAPAGVDKPYLHRWELFKDNAHGNMYLHLQVDHDPMDRGLHDHPWSNMSVILAGGYIEHWKDMGGHEPMNYVPLIWKSTRRTGDTIYRPAYRAHRLELPDGVPYTLTQFSTGPKVQDWGFWMPNDSGGLSWVSNYDVVRWVSDKVCVMEGFNECRPD